MSSREGSPSRTLVQSPELDLKRKDSLDRFDSEESELENDEDTAGWLIAYVRNVRKRALSEAAAASQEMQIQKASVVCVSI